MWLGLCRVSSVLFADRILALATAVATPPQERIFFMLSLQNLEFASSSRYFSCVMLMYVVIHRVHNASGVGVNKD
jgi:hypothetical protein